MTEAIERMCEALRAKGWTVTRRSAPPRHLPECVQRRYPQPSAEWLEFLQSVDCCMNPDGSIWLLCMEDFYRPPENGFRWNEFELIGLQDAEELQDLQGAAAIGAFWMGHLPVCLAVGGEYEYYAIRVTDGHIVYGTGPGFDAAEEFAASFSEFAQAIANGEGGL